MKKKSENFKLETGDFDVEIIPKFFVDFWRLDFVDFNIEILF